MKEQSIKHLLGKGSPYLREMKNQKTARQYTHITARFSLWLSEQGIKRPTQLKAVYGSLRAAIQAYVDHLTSQGKTPATVHTYAAACCVAAGIPLAQISKPRRAADQIIRSRDTGKNDTGYRETASGKYDRLIQFQSVVGIRRAELARLTGEDLVRDEAGRPCVLVRKGKGGKAQLQRILPDDLETVTAYFDGTAKRLFSQEEMQNHIDLHRLRAIHAKKCYDYYVGLPDQERQRLRRELAERYMAAHPEPDTVGRFLREIDRSEGVYRLRGKSKALAEAQRLPTEYDRLALMAVSVYHLSHWRLDVTVTNYMLST